MLNKKLLYLLLADQVISGKTARLAACAERLAYWAVPSEEATAYDTAEAVLRNTAASCCPATPSSESPSRWPSLASMLSLEARAPSESL